MNRQISTYRPNSVWEFMNEVERVFEDVWNTPTTTESKTTAATADFAPAVDVHETTDYHLLSVDLPGIPQSDVKIDIQGGRLTISGERRRAESKNTGDFKRFERSYGTFVRSFQLPQNVDESKIQARMDNGVLEVMVPKAEIAKPRSVSIESGSKSGLFSRLMGKKDVAKADSSTDLPEKH